jgi:hypothetical protein
MPNDTLRINWHSECYTTHLTFGWFDSHHKGCSESAVKGKIESTLRVVTL